MVARDLGWIKHHGDGLPVRSNVRVFVRYRGGDESYRPVPAGDLHGDGLRYASRWDRNLSEFDIVAYRVAGSHE